MRILKMRSKQIKEMVTMITAACELNDWVVALPPDMKDGTLEGMIIGKEEYVESLIPIDETWEIWVKNIQFSPEFN